MPPSWLHIMPPWLHIMPPAWLHIMPPSWLHIMPPAWLHIMPPSWLHIMPPAWLHILPIGLLEFIFLLWLGVQIPPLLLNLWCFMSSENPFDYFMAGDLLNHTVRGSSVQNKNCSKHGNLSSHHCSCFPGIILTILSCRTKLRYECIRLEKFSFGLSERMKWFAR